MAELTLGKKALQKSSAEPNNTLSPYEASKMPPSKWQRSLDFGFEVREGNKNAGQLPL